MSSLESSDDRWERRLERERAARRQAERLAEKGMRDLWQANQDLQERVAQRTAALHRALAVEAYIAAARLELLAGLVRNAVSDQVGLAGAEDTLDAWAGRLVTDPVGAGPTVAERESISPRDVVAELSERWQAAAARRGLLLAPSAVAGDEVVAPWSRLLAAAHAVLGGVVSVAAPGPLHLDVSCLDDRVVVTVDDAGPSIPTGVALPDSSGGPPPASAWLPCSAVGGRAVGLAIAQGVTSADGLSMAVRPGPLGGVRIVVSAPIAR